MPATEIQPLPLPDALVAELRDATAAAFPAVVADLEDLVRIPSVSAPAFDQTHVEASAAAVADLLRGVGLEPEILRVPGGAPAVVAHHDAGEGAAHVVLYAHHDVQPPGEGWSSPAFEPTRVGERLVGRGAADDKAGVMAHVGALRVLRERFGQDLPVSVTVFVEGEEEIGSPTFAPFLAAHGHRVAGDVIVVADSANWKVGTPALTTSLRGLVDLVVRVDVLDHPVHSGMFGGPVLDALTLLARLVATLHDEDGAVAVAGLTHGTAAALDYPEEMYRAEAGVLDGVVLAGRGTVQDRLWAQPAIAVIGIDAPSVEHASNTLAATASAKISLRLAPGQDPLAAQEALTQHLTDHAPFGARVIIDPGSAVARSSRRPTARPCGRPAARSRRRGAPPPSTSAWVGRSPSSPTCSSSPPRRRSSSPASRTPTLARTAPTSRSTSASWRRPCSRRSCCSPRCDADPPVRVLLTAGHLGELPGHEVAAALARGWAALAPEADLVHLPTSDGDRGLLDAVEAALGGRREVVTVPAGDGASGARQVPAVVLHSGGTAWIATADVLGRGRDATRTSARSGSSAGVGALVAAARDAGARRVVLGAGTPATLDAGTGMLRALAGRAASPFDPDQSAEGVAAVVEEARRRCTGLEIVLTAPELVAARGLRGAAAALTPVLGAQESQALDTRIAPLVRAFERLVPVRRDLLVGAAGGSDGAAGAQADAAATGGTGGGLGLAVLALGGRVLPGPALLAAETGLSRLSAERDLVVVVTERLDPVEADRGITAAVAAAAAAHGVAVLALAPHVQLERRTAASAGISATARLEVESGAGPEDVARAVDRHARAWRW
nr:M20/M25/M40 family metallo-hydrolase [Litorihabitans aurantiacus]